MNNYEIKKQNRGFIKPFADYAAAEAWAISYFTDGFTIVDLGTIPPLTNEEKLERDINFGRKLIKRFLIENRNLGIISTNDSIVLKNKFKDIEDFCRYGSIKDVRNLIDSLQTDAIFTPQRKSIYLNDIDNFLNNNE